MRAPGCTPSGEETEDNPTVIVSGGYDGVECVTDIRDMCGNVMNRTRGSSSLAHTVMLLLTVPVLTISPLLLDLRSGMNVQMW